MARRVPDILFRLTELSLEGIICELIDNSLDEKAKKVKVEFFGTDKKRNDVGIAVYDDGAGFGSKKKLWDSMEIEVEGIGVLRNSIADDPAFTS